MKIFFTLLFVVLAHLGNSQTFIVLARPFEKKEWGFVNMKGEFISEPVYRRVNEFSKDGYAPAFDEKDGKYVFIDKKGEKLKTDLVFTLMTTFGANIGGFTNGLAPVRIRDQWGFMNVQGKEAIKAVYDKVTEFNEGYAVALRGGKRIIIDVNGKETVVTDPKVDDVKHFEEGLAPFYTKEKQSGFIDATGKVVIEPQYGSVGYFRSGLAWARAADGKLGYINQKGEWIISPQFLMAKDYDIKSGVALAKTMNGWVYIDKSGKVIPMNNGSENFDNFSEGLCSGKKGGKVGFYDKTGKWVIEPQFDGVRDFKNGYAAAKMVDKWGIIDTSGKWIIQPKFSATKDMELAD